MPQSKLSFPRIVSLHLFVRTAQGLLPRQMSGVHVPILTQGVNSTLALNHQLAQYRGFVVMKSLIDPGILKGPPIGPYRARLRMPS